MGAGLYFSGRKKLKNGCKTGLMCGSIGGSRRYFSDQPNKHNAGELLTLAFFEVGFGYNISGN